MTEQPAETLRRVAGEMRRHALDAVNDVQTNPYWGVAPDPPSSSWHRVGDPGLDLDVAYARGAAGGLGEVLAGLCTPSLVAAAAELLENAIPYADMAHPDRYPIVADGLRLCREWAKARDALIESGAIRG